MLTAGMASRGCCAGR